MTICRACHWLDLSGTPGPPPTPSLASVRAYSKVQFERALLAGIALDGCQLDRMYMLPRFFQQLTRDEIDGLYAYLHTAGLP